MRRRGFFVPAVVFCLTGLAFSLMHFPLVFDLEHFPIRDSFAYHFQSFWVFANSLKHHLRPSSWFVEWGGWPTIMGLPSLNYFLPNKLIGYLIYSLTKWPAVLLYKLTLVLGVCLIATSTMAVARRLGTSWLGSAFIGVCILSSGLAFTPFHQDQIIATVFWYPILALAIIGNREDSRWRGLPFIFLALMLSAHYPLIHFMIFFLGAVLLFLRNPSTVRTLLKFNWRVGILVLAALYPFLYIVLHLRDFTSPLREGLLLANTLEKYIELNSQQKSSAAWSYFLNLIFPGHSSAFDALPLAGQDDMMLFFLPRLALVIALWGAWIYRKTYRLLLVLTLFSAWAATGINGGLAQILYFSHLPGIEGFRQWYHFSALFILGMCYFAGLGVEDLISRKKNPRMKGLFATLIFMICVADGVVTSRFYAQRFGPHYPNQLKLNVSKDEFAQNFGHMDHVNLFAYPEAYSFLKGCSPWRKREAVLLSEVPDHLFSSSCPELPADFKSLNLKFRADGIDFGFGVDSPTSPYVLFPVAIQLVRSVRSEKEELKYRSFHGLTLVENPLRSTLLKLRVDSVSRSLGWALYLIAMLGAFYGLVRNRREVE